MAFFSKKSSNILGIDLGSSTMKLVELNRNDGQPQLVTYGIALKEEVTAMSDARAAQPHLADTLRELLVRSHATTNRVVAALPAPNVFNTIIELPVMPKKEIPLAIQWEAKKLVPTPLAEMSFDWHVLPAAREQQGESKKKMMKIILTAAPKDIVARYLSLFDQLNLRLVGLETEVTALRRCLLPADWGTFILIDIGATNTGVIVFTNGIPLMTRHLNVGGTTISRNIADSLNINVERAEQFRNDFGLPAGSQLAHPVARAIQFVVDNMLIKELKNLIDTFRSNKGGQINEIILTGGVAHLKNLPDYLEKVMQIKTMVGNPWLRLSYPKELSLELEKIGPEMAVAIGLALKPN